MIKIESKGFKFSKGQTLNTLNTIGVDQSSEDRLPILSIDGGSYFAQGHPKENQVPS